MTHLKLCLNTHAKKFNNKVLLTRMGGWVCVGMCVLRKIGTLAKLYALCLRLTKTPRGKTDDIILIESILSFKYLTNFMENFWKTVRFFLLFWAKFITSDRIAQITQMKWCFWFLFLSLFRLRLFEDGHELKRDHLHFYNQITKKPFWHHSKLLSQKLVLNCSIIMSIQI